MLAHFLPQTVPFFKLLMEQNAVLQRMAQSLIVVMENTYESEGHLKQINILEEEADKLVATLEEQGEKAYRIGRVAKTAADGERLVLL